MWSAEYYFNVPPDKQVVPDFLQPRFNFEDLPDLSRKFIGVPYAPDGNSSITGFDSPHFIRTLFDCIEVKLPKRLSDLKSAPDLKPILQTEAKPGDLVFLKTNLNAEWVALYLGDGKVIAPFKMEAHSQVEEKSLEQLLALGFTILEFKRLKRDIPFLVEYAPSFGNEFYDSTLNSVDATLKLVKDVYRRFLVYVPTNPYLASTFDMFEEVPEDQKKPGHLVIGCAEGFKYFGILMPEDIILWSPKKFTGFWGMEESYTVKAEQISLADFKKQHPSGVIFKRPKTIPESY
ncbi:MAG: C40 family peptidase [Chlamydiia bacterium]|nr:C40 family peptidase [Chlamydiia bacterium]